MDEEEEENKKKKRRKVAGLIFRLMNPLIVIILIIVFVLCILGAAFHFFIEENGVEKDKKKNGPNAARNLINSSIISDTGNIELGETIQDTWNKLKKEGNEITNQLSSAEELAKLITAASALDYPDTRQNPDAPINWNDIDINSKDVQGIVKFKRALSDGNTITMKYVSPSKFGELVTKYRKSGKVKDRDEALKYFTVERTAVSGSNGSGHGTIRELLTYACSWVGKVPYKSIISGHADNTERFQRLQEGIASDCSHFVHWCFEHIGLMDEDGFVHSLDWGSGGENGGCPGTVPIGTDLSQASPGDVIWWHFGSGANNHVAIYLGNNKVVECSSPGGVQIREISDGGDQILHFESLPKDPTGYFDPDTMTLHSSISDDSGDSTAKVPSLQGMIFMGDSILSAIRARTSLENGEGAITMYQSGCNVEFFLGEENCSSNSDSNCSDGGYFKWDKQFSKITNPTGFYLMLGQNFFDDEGNRITRMDRLIKKIRSQYPSCPIYINSVLRKIERDDSNRTKDIKEKTLKMNEELKVYCLQNSNVFYSDVLKGYDESDEMLISHTYDDDHPNEEGAKILLNNIKANIVSNTASKNYKDFSNEEEILKITAIDYNAIPNSGWGDGIMLTSNGYHLLMDTFREQCRDSLDKYLEENNIYDFDIYISHDDTDHADNLNYLVEKYNVSKVYIPDLDKDFGEFDVDAIRRRGVNVIRLHQGMTFEIGGKNCVAEVIYGPDKSSELPDEDDNNRSLVTMIRAKTSKGDVTYLTGGDIEEYTANKILELGIDIKADIMKADHHGGGDTPEYIKKVSPSFYLVDFCNWYDKDEYSFIEKNMKVAEEISNVFSTMANGEISFSIKNSGNIVPTAQRNVEQIQFDVQDASGKTCTVTYTLSKESTHILTDRMKAAATNSPTSTALNNTIYKVKVATWHDSKKTITSKGDNNTKDRYVQESVQYEYSMTIRTIPFQEIVAQYKMPFNYLWSMLLISQDKKYVFDLADTVRNSKIEITVHDNLKETTTTKKENYVRDYIYTAQLSAELILHGIQSQTDPLNTVDFKGNATETDTDNDPKVFSKTTTILDRTNTLDVALTLADAWCVRYEKKYRYSGKVRTLGYPSEESLEDYEEEPIEHKDTITYEPLRNSLINKAKNTIKNKAINSGYNLSYNSESFNITSESEIINIKVRDRTLTTTVGIVEYKYLSSPGLATDNNSSYSEGYLYTYGFNNQIDTSKLNTKGVQQGFCMAGAYYAYVTENNNNSTLFLVDKNTNEQVSAISGIYGHGNTIAYDSKENQIIFMQEENLKMLIYKIDNGQLKYDGDRLLPKHDGGDTHKSSDLAYNEENDKFIFGEFVYNRDAFYRRGTPEKKISYQIPDNTELQGMCSYGNYVYYNRSSKDHKSGNYLIACNIFTGQEDELIYDGMNIELEEASFDSNGKLYLMYQGTKLYESAYNYHSDHNIDVRKVGNTSYSVGGNFYENNKFINVLNSHSSGRSNILRNSDWLFNLLEKNSDTANMVDLTKYLMYKASGINYGVTEFKFEAYGVSGVGQGQGSTLNLTDTSFTKEEFIQLVQSYSGALQKGSGTQTFRESGATIYDVCKRNNINPVLCAAQAWKEQNWDDPSTSPYNFWGIAVYNGQNYGKSWGSMEAAVQGYCDQINSQINGNMTALYQKRAQEYSTVNRKFVGDMSNIYDVFSAYAYKGDGYSLKAKADAAASYVDSLMQIATQIFGERALTYGGGNSNVVQFALQFEGKKAREFGLFSYTSKTGASNIWSPNQWCAMFVSFCFDNCGLIPNPLPNSYASCSTGWSLLGGRQRDSAWRGGNYVPQTGDIIFFGSNAGRHTGIVIECDGSTVYTIEGNTGGGGYENSTVNRREWALNDGDIWGYGSMGS